MRSVQCYYRVRLNAKKSFHNLISDQRYYKVRLNTKDKYKNNSNSVHVQSLFL
jgi:hypothetical protein